MGNLRLPKIIMSGELDKTGKHGPEGKENNWTDCVAKDCRLFGITGDWSARTRPWGLVQRIILRSIQAHGRLGEGRVKVPKILQRNSGAVKVGKVEVAPGVTVGSLRRFRPALIGPT